LSEKKERERKRQGYIKKGGKHRHRKFQSEKGRNRKQ